LEGGWIDFARNKTGIDRRCPLWTEILEALKAAIADRPKAKDPADAGLVFLTKYGMAWTRLRIRGEGRETESTVFDSIYPEFHKLFDRAKINNGRGFYSLRHTFEAVGGRSKDQVAVNAIMGHVNETLAATYREGIEDSRLQTVVDAVRAWLFPVRNIAASGTNFRRQSSNLGLVANSRAPYYDRYQL